MGVIFHNPDDIKTRRGIAARFSHIHFIVRNTDNVNVLFKMNIFMPFRKMRNVYCVRMDVPLHTYGFTYKGENISLLDTPVSIDLKEYDYIFAYII